MNHIIYEPWQERSDPTNPIQVTIKLTVKTLGQKARFYICPTSKAPLLEFRARHTLSS